ncbi:hypothetical protein PBY51_005635 [Eleginops maclovinus]|uniref:C2H2-type domain-containing protein n=2 Tax=Eleginops maclovinus TaxID=56733 RepID=A0AAN8AD72_ELEMC|nr:hypothetical protein PBY51_005635 [Eleginops maclovinus]
MSDLSSAAGGSPPLCPPGNSLLSSASSRDLSSVSLGAAWPRWVALRAATGLQRDPELALLLLDHYERVSSQASDPPLPPQSSASCRIGASQEQEDLDPPACLGADLPMVGPRETMASPESPGLTAEDVVGFRDAIVSEQRLRQLAALTQLPVRRCRQATCRRTSPFQFQLQHRATAFTLTWVCPRGHAVWSWSSQPGLKGPPPDILKVIVGEEEPEPPPHIKEEQEEADIKSTFTPVPLKSEDEEEEPQSSQLHHRQTVETEAGGEDCGGPEPARSSDPETGLQPETGDNTGDSSETEVSDGDWEETGGSGSQEKKNELPVDIDCNVERSFSCSECGQRFGRKPHLYAHMRIHTGEKPFSCSFCGKRFSQKGNSISHMRLHTGEKPFSCSICSKQFRYSGDVSRHMKIHTGKKSVAHRHMGGDQSQPDLKDKASDLETKGSEESSEPLLSEEVMEERCEADKELFSCSECSRTFCRRDHLMSHMRIHTGEKPFSCSVCQKRFSCSGNILAHMRIHTGEKPFKCSFCQKSFSQKGTLKLHLRIHTGEKPFSCPFCEKRFAHKRRMTLHMSVHTEEKRFNCGACNRKFTWYTQLKTHQCVGESSQRPQSQMEKTSGAKEAFSCPGCDKTFSLKGNLKTHMRIHTGEKPFSCSVCGKSFKQNVHLTEHMTIHTGEKLYSCSVCGKGFNKKSLVTNHPCFKS